MVKVEVKNVVKEDEPNVERKEHGKDGEIPRLLFTDIQKQSDEF